MELARVSGAVTAPARRFLRKAYGARGHTAPLPYKDESVGDIWKPLFHHFIGGFIFGGNRVFSVLFSLKFTGTLPRLTGSWRQRHFLSRHSESEVSCRSFAVGCDISRRAALYQSWGPTEMPSARLPESQSTLTQLRLQ